MSHKLSRRPVRCLVFVALFASSSCGSAPSNGSASGSGGHAGPGGATGTGGAQSGGTPGTGGAATGGGGARTGGVSGTGGVGIGSNTGGARSGGAIGTGTVITPGDPGATDVKFEIRIDRNVHAISPLIYRTNQPQNPAQNRYTVLRSGGNRMTAYNWENNASNAGSDYMFQNDAFISDSNTPGAGVQGTLTGAKAIGATALMTIPIVDYVSADKNGGGDVRNSGTNYLQTRFKQNRAVKGTTLSATPDATDAYVNQDEFVNWVKTTTATNGPAVMFSLDNEPDLWSHTHAEVHPNAVTYDELCTRNATYAKMVKSVWPSALVTGFVSYGWLGYVNLQSAPDASGKPEFIDYYLDRMKSAETEAGKRVIDYLDLHWYPEAQGGGIRITGSDTGAAVVAARVQAPRSLWDTAYKETSWIVDDALKQPIRLIPRIKDKIAAHYPGTRLAMTEWNYGGGQHISGAIAVADVLGIFGREDVGLATYWALNSNENFANIAFRAYRNFDGANSAFGDTSIYAASSDVATATVYGSVDAADPNRVVIVAVNKATTAKTAGITLAHSATFASLKVFTVTSSGAQVTAGANVPAKATNAFAYAMPAQSVSVLVPTN
jgi:hypothetical protein